MFEKLQNIFYTLMLPEAESDEVRLLNPLDFFPGAAVSENDLIPALCAAFLIRMAGPDYPRYSEACDLFRQHREHPVAIFFQDGFRIIKKEFESESVFKQALNKLHSQIKNRVILKNREQLIEALWSLFFPEGNKIFGSEKQCIENLRKKRVLHITEVNKIPIDNPAGEIIFTGNILLTVPDSSSDAGKYPPLEEQLRSTMREPQLYWYDHPIPVGTAPEKNEIIYGLNGLQETLRFEIDKGNVTPNTRLTCILSVSVTHDGLHEIAKPYITEIIKQAGRFPLLDIYLFTEDDCKQVVEEIFVPAAKIFQPNAEFDYLFRIFGVDGEYGRHYNFLKAVAAVWQTLKNPNIKATFKIDMDQVFPQRELIRDTGKSAFEHLTTPLWGAQAQTTDGNAIDLGMIAGALVNAVDIKQSVFTPDITFPGTPDEPDEYIFFSKLPQALSTESEMMTKYSDEIDGTKKCIQRIHVTGGTTGIRIEDLRKFRPFTPSFIGRAEDQAYIMSGLLNGKSRLGYVHQAGLIMRHDKELFAKEAIEKAKTGKILGDYIRILYFSAYAREIDSKLMRIKEILDPFTGCFISYIPATVVILRFVLRTLQLYKKNQFEEAAEFVQTGIERLTRAIEFTDTKQSKLAKKLREEIAAWSLFYDCLTFMESTPAFLYQMRERFDMVLQNCRI